jgi:hypothetical protein
MNVLLLSIPASFAPVAMAFPVDDWQFWAATAAFLVALAWLLRGVAPIPVLSRRHRRRRRQRSATLTIEGKTPER